MSTHKYTPLQLKWKKLTEEATIPTLATPGSACFDFKYIGAPVTMKHGQVYMLQTGLSVEVPQGYVMHIYGRSGLACKGFMLANGVGVLDSDYRGEIRVIALLGFDTTLTINPGDRIAQGCIQKVLNLPNIEVNELSETVRGEGGFGSTGK